MKRSQLVTALIALLAAVLMAPVAAAQSPDRVDLCHRPDRVASDQPAWRLISVSAKSLDRHLDHGDGEPLGEVPGSDGTVVFDEACQVVEASPSDDGDPGDPDDQGETVFAIAYSDLDQNGAFSDADVLIAKFIDGPSPYDDGLPGAGDLIVADSYPLELDLSTYGEFQATEHTTTGASSTSTKCLVSTDSGSFIWEASSSVDNYEERSLSGELSYFRDSTADGGSDAVVADTASPSLPNTPVFEGDFDDVDDPFIEVELACSD